MHQASLHDCAIPACSQHVHAELRVRIAMMVRVQQQRSSSVLMVPCLSLSASCVLYCAHLSAAGHKRN